MKKKLKKFKVVGECFEIIPESSWNKILQNPKILKKILIIKKKNLSKLKKKYFLKSDVPINILLEKNVPLKWTKWNIILTRPKKKCDWKKIFS